MDNIIRWKGEAVEVGSYSNIDLLGFKNLVGHVKTQHSAVCAGKG
jgi:hypothetical protein